MGSEIDVQDLELQSLIGFDGNALNGLILHPDGIHLVYPLGSNITAFNWSTKKQRFYEGHNNVISAVAVSKFGKYVAASQVTYMGFKSPIIAWDFKTGEIVTKYEAHKIRVESIAFSCCENFLMSLGGFDDGSITVYDIEKLEVLCGSSSVKSSAGQSTVLKSVNSRNECFIVAGDNIFRIWTINKEQRSVQGVDVSFAKIKRKILCAEINYSDDCVYCGTSTGDVVKIKLNLPSDASSSSPSPTLLGCFAKHPSAAKGRGSAAVELYSKGVTALHLIPDDRTVVVGSGDGVVELVEQKAPARKKNNPPGPVLSTPTRPLLVALRSANVGSLVTSMQIMMRRTLLVGTVGCELFAINVDDFAVARVFTCHASVVYDLTFPHDNSDVFATAGRNDVRVWSAETLRELLRITVKNLTCSGVVFVPDGSQIITSWNDGKIRSFTPETGRMLFIMDNCHNSGVTAVAVTGDGQKLLSGGGDGQVRVWRADRSNRALLAVLKEHKGPVSSIDVHRSGREAISSSSDGTCVVWDIVRFVRLTVMFSSSVFTCAKYHPNDVQLLTCGTNRCIGFWESLDGSLVREIEGSAVSALNSLDVSSSGKYVVTGSSDQLIKVWLYNEGTPTHVGVGHAGVVTNVKISPNGRFVVSTSEDGSIFRWRFPHDDEDAAAAGSSSRGGSGDTMEQRQTARSRLLSQKKTTQARQENVGSIKSLKSPQAKTYDGASGGGTSPPDGSVKCLCRRGTTCNCADGGSGGGSRKSTTSHAVA